MQSSPKRVASRTPCHETGGCGGRQRSGPTGGAAYGIPLKVRISPFVPATAPAVVATIGVVAGAPAVRPAGEMRHRRTRWAGQPAGCGALIARSEGIGLAPGD